MRFIARRFLSVIFSAGLFVLVVSSAAGRPANVAANVAANAVTHVAAEKTPVAAPAPSSACPIKQRRTSTDL
ncbi:MAG: hypothetical protein ABUL67_01730 [Haliangium ochraceum]